MVPIVSLIVFKNKLFNIRDKKKYSKSKYAIILPIVNNIMEKIGQFLSTLQVSLVNKNLCSKKLVFFSSNHITTQIKNLSRNSCVNILILKFNKVLITFFATIINGSK